MLFGGHGQELIFPVRMATKVATVPKKGFGDWGTALK